MIRILIVTDNTSEWVTKIRQEVKVSLETGNRGQHLIKSNSLFYFDIRQNINENFRGQKYTSIILDKVISKELIDRIFVPMVATPQALIYTERGVCF